MTVPQIFVVLAVVIPLGFVVINRLRPDVAAITIATILAAAQYLGMGVLGNPDTPGDAVKALSGLSQPVVVTLFSLFVLTRCLESTGIINWSTHRVLAVSGTGESRLIMLFAAATAFVSLFVNNLAAGALLLPSALEASRRTGIKPSKLLIPISYGSLLGGAATYFTTANIIASNLLATANPPQHPLGILDFTPTGGLIALAGIAFMGLFGARLLPDREPPADVFANSRHDQPVQWGRAAFVGIVVLVAVAFSLFGVPVYLAMLVGAVVVILAGMMPIQQIYREMEWNALFLIAAMFSVSTAMVNTGLAALLGQAMINVVSPLGPLGLAAGSYLFTSALVQFMGGQVTALVTAPIAISAAISLGISPQAVAVVTAIGCSASFITPIAHPVNILMIRPANYTFGDFARIGVGLTAVTFVALLIGMKLFWRL